MRRSDTRQQGQMIVLFGISLIALVLLIGLVVDGGFAFVERRNVQNAADFAALAGARVVAQARVGDAVNGDAAWYYPAPKDAAKQIANYVAFWKGVQVEA